MASRLAEAKLGMPSCLEKALEARLQRPSLYQRCPWRLLVAPGLRAHESPPREFGRPSKILGRIPSKSRVVVPSARRRWQGWGVKPIPGLSGVCKKPWASVGGRGRPDEKRAGAWTESNQKEIAGPGLGAYPWTDRCLWKALEARLAGRPRYPDEKRAGAWTKKNQKEIAGPGLGAYPWIDR